MVFKVSGKLVQDKHGLLTFITSAQTDADGESLIFRGQEVGPSNSNTPMGKAGKVFKTLETIADIADIFS